MLAVYVPQKIEGEALFNLLSRRNLAPAYFQSTEGLLDKIRFGLVDILILDLSSIPNLNKDLETILEMAQDVAVIMVTPYAATEWEMHRFQERGYHIMEKPIPIGDLIQLIHSLAKGKL